jgi:cytoskeletal protein RodZ
MRFVTLTAIMTLSSSAAFAGSIDSVMTESNISPSQTLIICQNCPPPPKPQKVTRDDEPKWKPGAENIEIRDINGAKKRFSKEAWFGGSPVLFVTKAPGEAGTDTAATQPMPGVDPASTTAALTEQNAAMPMDGKVAAEGEMAPEDGAMAKANMATPETAAPMEPKKVPDAEAAMETDVNKTDAFKNMKMRVN